MDAEMLFAAETELEAQICADPEWRRGVEWGKPRRGHPEGAVKNHIAEVLANLDRNAPDVDARRRLRLIALIHDAFKSRVDVTRPRVGDNHHGTIARRFAERFITEDPVVLDIIELHDEAFNAYSVGERRGDWPRAEARALRLIERLGPNIDLYTTFFRCDNETGTKSSASYEWFVGLTRPPATRPTQRRSSDGDGGDRSQRRRGSRRAVRGGVSGA
jgi:hypothetical protein